MGSAASAMPSLLLLWLPLPFSLPLPFLLLLLLLYSLESSVFSLALPPEQTEELALTMTLALLTLMLISTLALALLGEIKASGLLDPDPESMAQIFLPPPFLRFFFRSLNSSRMRRFSSTANAGCCY
jgi:hypothetical protein